MPQSPSESSLKPGLLSVFKMFVLLQLILYSLIELAFLVAYNFNISQYILQHPFPWFIALVTFIFLLLWTSPFQLKGLRLLNVVLFVIAVVPFILMYIQIFLDPDIFKEHPYLPTPLLVYSLVAVLLIAWQYGFKVVLQYCGFTLLLEFGFLSMIGLHKFSQPNLLSFTFDRIILSLLAGYLVSKLVEAEKKQHHKLIIANEQLKQFNESLEELAISRERNRLARELHDTMAHHMSGMALQLEGVRLLWERDPDKARELLEQSINTTREGIQETRRALKALRAQPLEDLGLLGAIKEQVETLADRQSLTLCWQAPSSLLPLGGRVEQNLFRIFQEALRNIEQHAQAKTLTCTIEDSEETLCFELSDDGVGFDFDEKKGNSRFGLTGMLERAEEMGARLNIQSSPDKGTTLLLQLSHQPQESHR
jgi:signal transduction histidine kinase